MDKIEKRIAVAYFAYSLIRAALLGAVIATAWSSMGGGIFK